MISLSGLLLVIGDRGGYGGKASKITSVLEFMDNPMHPAEPGNVSTMTPQEKLRG